MADEQKKQKKSGGGGVADFPYEIIILLIALFFAVFQIAGLLTLNIEGVRESIYVQRFLLSLKILSGFAVLFSFGGIAYSVVQMNAIQRKEMPLHEEGEPDYGDIRKVWRVLKEKIAIASDSDAAYLIIEADTIIDRVLRMLKIPGETMGERIKALSREGFTHINDLWEAHKIRNEVAHEGGGHITYSDAVYTFEKYEKVLVELGVL